MKKIMSEFDELGMAYDEEEMESVQQTLRELPQEDGRQHGGGYEKNV